MIFVNQIFRLTILALSIFPRLIFPRLIFVPLFSLNGLALNRLSLSSLGRRNFGGNAGRFLRRALCNWTFSNRTLVALRLDRLGCFRHSLSRGWFRN